MSARIEEASLPQELDEFGATEAAYADELSRSYDALRRRLPVMIECEKELTPYLFRAIRDRLKADEVKAVYLDGRPGKHAPPQPNAMAMGLMQTMIAQLRDTVRGAVDERVVVLPHLDLLTASSGGLTTEAREVIPLLYENPRILWLGFKDPSFSVPKVIENVFPHRESILGIPRAKIAQLITQRESRKFGRGLNPFQLYKFISGMNAVRLRRVLRNLDGEDYPTDPTRAFEELRLGSMSGDLTIPNLDLENDIGGYAKVKSRLKTEIIDLLVKKDSLDDDKAIKRIEGLVPRGIIFWGPPGTGKTLFAKAMATSLGAAVTVISGPELKSKWVGESEERIRQIFIKARQSAPAVIVFDELDSFASARGTYTGSGVEHSMVNQLLTEMDGFRKEELVFVVGTTNFAEILDPALLRPGRFEFHLEIPYPGRDDRRAIFEIYNEKLALQLSTRALDYAVRQTGNFVQGTQTRYSGDHIQALCRALARKRLRGDIEGEAQMGHVDDALTEYLELPDLTRAEEFTVATHEAGHAVVALFTEHSLPIERISIRGDLGGALGFVKYADPAHRYVVTRGQLLDRIAMLFGGREAEAVLLDDISIGSNADLERATDIARSLVEEFGLVETVGVRRYLEPDERKRPQLAEHTRTKIDAAVLEVLDTQRARARQIIEENAAALQALRDLLIENKVLDAEAFGHLFSGVPTKSNAAGGETDG